MARRISKYAIVSRLLTGEYVLLPNELVAGQKNRKLSALYAYLEVQKRHGKFFTVRSAEEGVYVRRIK